MLPTAADVHVNAPLTNISVAWLQAAPAVSDLIFPIVDVKKQSDVYWEFNRADFSRIEMDLRAPGTKSKSAGYRVDASASYFAKTYALRKAITKEVRANSDAPLNPDRNAAQFLMQQAKLKREKLFAASFWTTSVWGTDVTGSTAGLWSDDSSDPIGQIETYKNTVLEATGMMPNTLAMNNAVFAKLKNHPLILDRIKHTQLGVATKELIAMAMGLKQIVVGQLVETSSKEGNATQTLAAIMGNHALLAYVPDAPGLETPAAGYTFAWSGDDTTGGVGVQGVRTYRYYNVEERCDYVDVEQSIAQTKISGALGVFFNTII
jgi:hypothetical protein